MCYKGRLEYIVTKDGLRNKVKLNGCKNWNLLSRKLDCVARSYSKLKFKCGTLNNKKS